MTRQRYAQLDVAACQQLIKTTTWFNNIDTIDPILGCHNWRKNKVKKNSGNPGYPEIKLQGKTRYAHRIALIAFLGRNPHPATPEAAHRCANSLCVNPWHLQETNHTQNMADNKRPRLLTP